MFKAAPPPGSLPEPPRGGGLIGAALPPMTAVPRPERSAATATERIIVSIQNTSGCRGAPIRRGPRACNREYPGSGVVSPRQRTCRAANLAHCAHPAERCRNSPADAPGKRIRFHCSDAKSSAFARTYAHSSDRLNFTPMRIFMRADSLDHPVATPIPTREGVTITSIRPGEEWVRWSEGIFVSVLGSSTGRSRVPGAEKQGKPWTTSQLW